LNVTVFVVRVWGREYRTKLIMNIPVFEDLAEANFESLLRVAIKCALPQLLKNNTFTMYGLFTQFL